MISLPAFLTEIAKWFFVTFGQDITILVKNQIQSRFRRVFDNRAILILGSTGTGKTALIWYLVHGKPYQENESMKNQPNPTLGTVVLDENVTLSKDAEVRMGRIQSDVGGEFHDEWQRLIWEINPHGIIYMLDGRLEEEDLRKAIEEIFEFVLQHYKTEGLRQLKSLHVFLNFADHWAKSRLDESKKRALTEVYFNEIRDTPEWARIIDLNFMVSVTQLSTDRPAWTEVDKALEHFAADLAGKK